MSDIVAKRVSNYELFYDLVFVLAVSGLNSFLHQDHLDFVAIASFIFATMLIMGIWFLETIYLNKYGERDLIDIITIIIAMFSLGNLALNMGLDFEEKGVLFNFWLLLSYLVIVLQYYLRGRKIGFSLDIKNSLSLLGSLVLFSAIMLGIALLHYPIAAYILVLIYGIPIILPFIFQRRFTHHNVNFPHLLERCQLITIIAFGESVVGIIKVYPAPQSLTGFWLFLGMAFLFVFYISQTYYNMEHHQRANVTRLIYAHLGVIMGINFFTVGSETFIGHHHEQSTHLILLGLVLFYSSVMALNRYNKKVFQMTFKDYIPYLVVLCVGLVSLYVLKSQTTIFLLIFNALTLLMVYVDIYFANDNI